MIRLFFALLSFALLSCGAKGTKETGNMPEIKKQPIASAVPDFNADSAYAYVANQVAFGPRVPNTAAHKACGDYLASELKRFGAKVYQQEAILTAYDGTKLEARNIIGSFDPENSKRVLSIRALGQPSLFGPRSRSFQAPDPIGRGGRWR